MPVSNQYVFFGKMSTQFLGPFLKNGFRVFCGSHTNFRIISSSSLKNGVGIMIEIELNR